MNNIKDILPIITSVISLCSAIMVVFIGFYNAKSIENFKTKTSYLNTKLSKLIEAYQKYDPTLEIEDIAPHQYLRAIEAKFKNCKSIIQSVSPLIDSDILLELDTIEKSNSEIHRSSANAKLNNLPEPHVDINKYSTDLTNYIDEGHRILANEIRKIKEKLE